jgi:hypothetical protein
MHDLQDLDLVELVVADHAARVLARGARLRAKARRVAHELERQLLQRNDLLAHEVRDRHLGCRDEVQVAVLDLEQVAAELGEAGDTVGAGPAHHVGDIDLGVAVLPRVHVEHELRQRAVQARDAAFHHREARAGELGGRLEIQAERRTDVDVVLRRKIELARRSPAARFDVLRRGAADRHALMRDIGNQRHELAQLRLQRLVLALQRLELLADLRGLRHQGRGLRVVLLRLRLPDLLGERVPLRLQLLGGGLDAFARILERPEARDVERIAARGQALRHRVDVASEELDVDHVLFFARASAFRRLSSASFSRILCSSPRPVGRYHSTSGMPSGK